MSATPQMEVFRQSPRRAFHDNPGQELWLNVQALLGDAHGEKGARMCAVALLPLGFDFLENALAIWVMAAYPVRFYPAAWALTAATSLKWIFMGGVCVLIIYGLLAWPVCFVRRRLAGESN